MHIKPLGGRPNPAMTYALSSPPPGDTARLQRVVTLKDLVFYGIVLIQPIAPVGIFGIRGT